MITYDPHRWYDHLFDIRGSMVREIFARVVLCVAWSLAVVLVDRATGHHIKIPTSVHQVMGTALGLLLVMRTNSSYDRFWEGRRLWGSITNTSRNLARGINVYLDGAPTLHAQALGWTQAFAFSTMQLLRGKHDWGLPAAQLPEPLDVAALGSKHLPLYAATRLAQTLTLARQRGCFSDQIHLAFEQWIGQLIDLVGGCERIRNTPLPYAYMVHLRRALILFCYTLPLALVEGFGLLTVPFTLIVAYVFFGIEEIGVEIEDPFGEDENDLPLDAICQGIAGVTQNLGATLERGVHLRQTDRAPGASVQGASG